MKVLAWKASHDRNPEATRLSLTVTAGVHKLLSRAQVVATDIQDSGKGSSQGFDCITKNLLDPLIGCVCVCV